MGDAAAGAAVSVRLVGPYCRMRLGSVQPGAYNLCEGVVAIDQRLAGLARREPQSQRAGA
jgi:hypothetical protein